MTPNQTKKVRLRRIEARCREPVQQAARFEVHRGVGERGGDGDPGVRQAAAFPGLRCRVVDFEDARSASAKGLR